MSDTNILEDEDFILTSHPGKVSDFELATFNLDEVEKQIIMKVLKKSQGNISHAAQELGITRTSLYRRMEKYAL